MIKNLLPGLVLAAVAAGCSDDTGPVECSLGEYSGDFHIETQSDAAALAGYTSISGELWIECPPCTDLSELICLESVGGDLQIESFYHHTDATLTNLDGLSALTSVGGRLSISWNRALTNLDGLSALTSVGGDLSIDLNYALTNLDGLGALTSVGGTLHVSDNDALTNLDGLSGITSVGGWGLLIDNNNSLTNLDGLSALTSVVYLAIYYNDALTNLDGLSGITSVSSLFIFANPALTNLDGLGALISVGGNNLVEGDDFRVNDNTVLPGCEVCDLLDQLTSGPASIDVHDNFDDECTPVPTNCPGYDAGVDGGP